VSTLGPGPQSELYGSISNGEYFALDFSRGYAEIGANQGITFNNSSFQIDFWLYLKPLNAGDHTSQTTGSSGEQLSEQEKAIQAAIAFAKQQELDEYGTEVIFSCGIRNSALSASHSCVSVHLERGLCGDFAWHLAASVCCLPVICCQGAVSCVCRYSTMI